MYRILSRRTKPNVHQPVNKKKTGCIHVKTFANNLVLKRSHIFHFAKTWLRSTAYFYLISQNNRSLIELKIIIILVYQEFDNLKPLAESRRSKKELGCNCWNLFLDQTDRCGSTSPK